MKKETIKRRLEKAKVNKTSSAYKLLIEWVNASDNYIIRPCWTSGRGRFCTNLDYTEQLKGLLTSLNVRYVSGNDAPRGGKCGNFIKIML